MEQTIFFFLLALLVSLAMYGFGVHKGRRTVRPSELAADEQLFQQIVETAPVGICIIRERKFAFVNDAYVRMFGYEASSEVRGRFVEELYTEGERKKQRGYARDRIAGKPVPSMYETVGLRKNGEEFEVSAWVSLIPYQGQLSSLGFVIDRSVETEMRRRLDHANRLEAVGTLAGGIAHDFNNILTAIIGYSELALLRCRDNQLVCGDLQQVLKAGNRAKDLIQQILLFSRKQNTLSQTTRLSVVVDEVVRFIEATLPAAIDMQVELDSEVDILANPTSIHQLIMNLCTNAEHAMRTIGGTMTIQVTRYTARQGTEQEYPGLTPGEYALLKVCDTGNGIPPAIREQIFEPFFTTKQVGEGTGIGLAQVHAIVRSHGGYVSFTDNSPQGTVFSVLFPLLRNEEKTELSEEFSLTCGRGRILLVDDEKMVLEVIERTLCELGYDVVASQNARDALTLFTDEPERFDLVITDINMPGMTGHKLATQIKALCPEMPVIFCTGYSASLEEHSDLQAVSAVLEKPVETTLLAETVAGLLDSDRRKLKMKV